MYVNKDGDVFEIGSDVCWVSKRGDGSALSTGVIIGEIYDNLAEVKRDGGGEQIRNLDDTSLIKSNKCI